MSGPVVLLLRLLLGPAAGGNPEEDGQDDNAEDADHAGHPIIRVVVLFNGFVHRLGVGELSLRLAASVPLRRSPDR